MDIKKTIQLDATLTGAEKVTGQLNEIGVAGQAAASKVEQGFLRNTTDAAKLQMQLTMLTQATQNWSGMNAVARNTVASVAAAIETEGAMATATAAQVTQLAAATAIMSGAAAEATTANTALASSHVAAGSAMGMSGREASMMRMHMSGLLGSTLGVNGAVVGLTGALGSMAVGSVVVIGIMAGIAAMVYGWDKLSLSLQGVTADQKKAMDEFEKAQKLAGAGGKVGVAETGFAANVAKIQGQIDFLNAQITTMQSPAGASAAGVSPDAAAAIAGSDQIAIANLRKTLDTLEGLHSAANAKRNAEMQKEALAGQAQYAEQLATLVKNGNATDAIKAQALTLEKNYFAASTLLAAQGSRDVAAEYSKLAETLKGAFTTADKVPKGSAVSDGAAADKAFADALAVSEAKVTQSLTDQAAAIHLANEAMRQGTASGATYLIQKQYELEVTKSLSDSTDEAAAAHVKAAAAVRDEALAHEALITAQKNADGTNALLAQAAALKLENDAMRQGETTRATYLINKTADLEVSKALAITDADAHAARVQAIEEVRSESLAHLGLVTAQQEAAKEAAKSAADAAKSWKTELVTLTRDVQRDFAAMWDSVFNGGADTFGKLWKTIWGGWTKLIADMLGADMMRAVGDKLTAFLSGGANAKVLANPNSGPAAVAGAGGTKGWDSFSLGYVTSFVAGLGMIAASITTTSQLNAQAARQFASDNVTWAAAFKDLNASFTDTSAQKQVKALAAQYQTLMTSAIQEAATAIQNSPASTFGASGVGLFGSKTGTVPGAGTIADLDAYIKQLTAAQGTGKNVAQDRDLATLLKQLQDLDAEYKLQAEELAKVIAANQLAYQADLKVRELTAKGETEAAAAAQRKIEEDKQIADAQAAGYDAATIALLKQVQADEDLATAAAKAKAAADALAAHAETVFASIASSNARYLAATGQDWAAAQAQRAESDRQAMDALLKSMGDTIDPLAVAALSAAQAAEAAQAAWQHAMDVINQGNDWIKQQGALFGDSGQATLDKERQNFGFQGMTDAQILALYKQWTPGAELTASQKQLNDWINTFITDERSFANANVSATTGAATSAVSAASIAMTANVTTAVSATVTERTAYELVDVNRSQLVVLRSIDRGIQWLAGRGLIPMVNQGLGNEADNSNLSGGNVTRS